MDAKPWVAYCRRWSCAALALANAGFVLFCVAWGWPEWWAEINYEKSALTWFSSVQLAASGLCALACAALLKLPLKGVARRAEQGRVWAALAAAYLFLAVDERFQVHERLREGLFKPQGIGTQLPGVAPGDFLPLLYALAGLAVASRLYLYFSGQRRTRACLLAGLALAGASVILDTLDWHGRPLSFFRVEQFTEELLETGGQLGLLLAFTRHFWGLAEAALEA